MLLGEAETAEAMICETDGDCVRDDYSKCAAITVEADELITTIF